MCRGIYNADPGELLVEAVVGIGSVAPNNARTIVFLVDTGATATVVSAADATRLGLVYDNRQRPVLNNQPLRRAGYASGIGGRLALYELDDIFITIISHTSGDAERHTEHFDSVYVASPKYQDASLMGMDLLRRFRLSTDPGDLMVNLTRIPVADTAYLVYREFH